MRRTNRRIRPTVRTATVAATVTAALGASLLLATGPAGAAAAPAASHDDFNRDGYADLVVSAPAATVGGKPKAGYVAVLYGSAGGFRTTNRRVVNQSSSGVPGTPESGDGFGTTTASGDFDHDGYADLAVGVPGEDIGTVADAGGVTVLWGSASGLAGAGTWLQDDTPTAGNRHGLALAAGDFDAEGSQQLAVLSGDSLLTYSFSAATARSTARTARTARTAHTTHTTRVARAARSAADTGAVQAGGLTAGDYDHDGADDLTVLGIQFDLDGEQSGWSAYLRGGPDGLTYIRDVAGGSTGASGDINGDSYDDLVTGEPSYIDHDGYDDSPGNVAVLYGGPDGPGGASGSATIWNQDSPGVPGTAELGDRFGSALSLGDINGDGYADLAVGSDGEDIGGTADAGAVWLLRGSAGGLTAASVRTYNQNTASVPGTAEAADLFGGAVRVIGGVLVATAPGENYGNGFAWVLTRTPVWTFDGAALSAPTAQARFGAALSQ